jgi:signal transduction histidine kinase
MLVFGSLSSVFDYLTLGALLLLLRAGPELFRTGWEENRRQLLANLVHELGRPLGALRSAIHALSGGADRDEELRRELLAGMDDELQRLQRLLDDLAELHERVLGSLELNRRPTALGEWLPQALIPWQKAAQEKGLRWQTDIPPDLPTVLVDPDRLGQALGNLLSNAVKYTPAGGAASTGAGVEDDAIWVRVEDTGPGIAPEDLELIFTPFYRAARPRASRRAWAWG